MSAVTLTTAPAAPEPVAVLPAPTPRAEECAPLTPSTARSLSPKQDRVLPERAVRDARLRELWRAYQDLAAQGLTQSAAAERLGVSPATVSRLVRRAAAEGAEALARRYGSGRPCTYQPSAEELAAVREIYVRLDHQRVRGPNTGSSKIAAYRMAARGTDPRLSEFFRSYVLRRRTKRLPASWLRLLDQTAGVMQHLRQPGRLHVHVNTPRNRTWINAEGVEVPLQAGDIFESDDGTLNFYCWSPWPFGGDKCSDKYGVRLGRYQLLPVVDVRSLCIVACHVVVRSQSSYRGEDIVALFGDVFASVGIPQTLRLERGSWESQHVRDAIGMAGVPVVNAWHAKQKAAAEGAFNRLWTPMSLIRGHVGRTRGEYEKATKLAMACQDGSQDPRAHFLSIQAAMPEILRCVQYMNTEPVESADWGTWVPQDVFERQTAERPLRRLDPGLTIFFSREQRQWTVRGGVVGGSVTSPQLKVPVYFQAPELWEFEGIKTRCYFDPYAPEIRGTIILHADWKSYRRGHVIARDVPALDLPPTLVLAEDWGDQAEAAKTLAVRKAMAEAVRTEAWTWNGHRSSTARDGMGNVAQVDRSASGSATVVTGEPSHGREVDPGLGPQPILGTHGTRAAAPQPGALEAPPLSRSRAPTFVSAFEESLM